MNSSIWDFNLKCTNVQPIELMYKTAFCYDSQLLQPFNAQTLDLRTFQVSGPDKLCRTRSL
jgi:hypothetical protein